MLRVRNYDCKQALGSRNGEMTWAIATGFHSVLVMAEMYGVVAAATMSRKHGRELKL